MAAVRSTAASLREKIRRGECEGSSNAPRIPANDGRDVVRGVRGVLLGRDGQFVENSAA